MNPVYINKYIKTLNAYYYAIILKFCNEIDSRSKNIEYKIKINETNNNR